jgi:hypothetical protein
VNPYSLGFTITSGDAHGMMKWFVENNFKFKETRELIEGRIAEYERTGQVKFAEKWKYLLDYITGAVFDAEPSLREHW